MRLTRLLALCVVLVGTACGGGGRTGGGNPDAAVDGPPIAIDAPGGGGNALGQVCPFAAGGLGTMCPAPAACVTIMGTGSTITGYCTPDCMNNNAICTTGYTGPVGGQPQCALTAGGSTTPNGCAIVCTSSPQCPTGLSCLPVTGQNVSICVAP